MLKRIALSSVVLAVAVAAGFYMANSTIAQQPDDPRPPEKRRVEPKTTMAPDERARRYLPGEPWNGVGRGNIDQLTLETFTELPVLWAGPAVIGSNLQAIKYMKYNAPADIPTAKPRNTLSLIYGDCDLGQHNRCIVPLTINIDPICNQLPSQMSERVRLSNDLERVRGEAQLMRFKDGHVRLWTGSVSIFVDAKGDPTRVDEVVANLQTVATPLGLTLETFGGFIGPNNPLPAPDYSRCGP